MDNKNVFQMFGIDYNNPVIKTAFIHSSFYQNNDIKGEDYQKLEFLGDRVLNLIIASEMYDNCDSGTSDIGYRFRELVSNKFNKDYCTAIRLK